MLGTYNALLPAARAAVRLAALRSPKLRAGLVGRRGAVERLAAFGAAHAGRCIWFHAASVGEYEQTRPVTALLRQRAPDLMPLQTFFSPSGYEYASRLGEAPFFDYLPEDTPADVARVLDAVQPRALVFAKFDLWPNLITAAAGRGIPVVLFDATLQPRSWRSRGPARRLYRDVYEHLRIISAASAADAARFRAIVPRHPAIVVDGDTRFDQVVRRRRAAPRTALVPALVETRPPFTLVAGSTWGADEARLVPAWAQVAARHPGARLVLVPHEPTPAHLEATERALASHGLTARRYSALDPRQPPAESVVLVDRVGILAELYAAGDAAYVGGAFTTGVHNVLEPAIMGIPVLFGPRHDNAPETDMLLDARAATVIRSQAGLGAALEALAGDPAHRRAQGERARAVVEANLGASERCVERLLGCLAPAVSRESVR